MKEKLMNITQHSVMIRTVRHFFRSPSLIFMHSNFSLYSVNGEVCIQFSTYTL